MSVTCVTADHLSWVCSLSPDLLDWMGVVLQASWFIAGLLIAGSCALAFWAVFWRRGVA